MRNRFSYISYILILALVIAQLFVILGSWLWSAAMPESSVRAILSDSGIRWFFGSFVSNLTSPILVWIILLDIAIGACLYSGLWNSLLSIVSERWSANSRNYASGLWAAFGTIAIEGVVIALLTIPRHAILLSVTGGLFPSSFSESLIPILAFMLLSAAIVYGLFSGHLHNYRDVVHCCVRGGANLKLLLALYVLAMQLYKMVEYVIGSN